MRLAAAFGDAAWYEFDYAGLCFTCVDKAYGEMERGLEECWFDDGYY